MTHLKILLLAMLLTPLSAHALEGTALRDGKATKEQSDAMNKINSVQSALTSSISSFQSQLTGFSNRLDANESLITHVHNRITTLDGRVTTANNRVTSVYQALAHEVNTLRSTLNAILACNGNKQFYNRSTGCQDVRFTTRIIVYPMVGGYNIFGDTETTDQWCKHNGYTGATTYQGDDFRSPGNNYIMYWKTNRFQRYSAGIHNWFAKTLTCYTLQ